MAAIMVGDIVGFSAMMEKSEEKTVARLATCQALISEKVASLDGRIFNRAGDATLAEFPSPINALRCAVEIGTALAGIDRSDDEPLRMRFGVHVADVAAHGDFGARIGPWGLLRSLGAWSQRFRAYQSRPGRAVGVSD